MVYLITGATGDIGSKVVEGLIRCGVRPRVFVRDEQKARLRFGERVDISVGDLSDTGSVRSALQGVDVLFLLNSGPQIPVLDKAAAIAAKAAGIMHLVKLSSMDVEHGLAIGAWHEQGENAIRATGLPFTFVQPTGFMSNLLAWARSVKTEGVIRSATGAGRRAFIHSEDIAAVSVRALVTRQYESQSLPVTGPEAVTFGEVAAKIGTAIGKSVNFLPIDDEDARQRYSAISGSEEETEAHVALWRAIREGRLAAVNDNVERILGRKPLTLDQWIAENRTAFLN